MTQKDENPLDIPAFEQVEQAAHRIQPFIRMTPVLEDRALNEMLGCELVIKCENLQASGAFKLRGASNAILSLREKGSYGDVATHSSGNHGTALAMAARLDGRQAHVVMPDNASEFKANAVREQGGIVYFCDPGQEAREAGLQELVAQGYISIPPYDHSDIIAGQGTACLELLQQAGHLDAVICPVGGGGLIGGTALVASHAGLQLFGAEPSGSADAAESLALGRRADSAGGDTIADGLRALVGIRNFTLIKKHVHEIITISDDEIRQAMVVIWRHFRLLVEPSSAVVVAALFKRKDDFKGMRVGAIISGGNITAEDWLQLTTTRGKQ